MKIKLQTSTPTENKSHTTPRKSTQSDFIGLVDVGVDFTGCIVTSNSLADDASSELGNLLAEGSGVLDPDGIPAEGGEDFAVFMFVESENVGRLL
jgi:hypothetical protein